MADVIRRGPGRRGADGPSGDRAQLLLVTGLALAILFVTLALVMNTVIYTENLATRSSKVAGGSEASGYREAVDDGLTDLFVRANYNNNTSHAALNANLSTGVSDWSTAATTAYAQSGTGSTVSIDVVEDGSRIRQDDDTRNFTDAQTDAGWTVGSDVWVRGFWMNVSRTSLNESTHVTADADIVFHVRFTDDDGDVWKVFLYEDTATSTANVSVMDPSLVMHGPCSSSKSRVSVNITAGTVGGADCPALDIFDDMNGPIVIEYQEATSPLGGDTGTGSYELIVNDSTLATGPPSEFNDDGTGESPWVTPALYATELQVTYQTPRLYYNATVRIAPGEP